MSDEPAVAHPAYKPGGLIPWTPVLATLVAMVAVALWGTSPEFGGDAYTEIVEAIYFIGAAITSCLALLCWRSWASDAGRAAHWRYRDRHADSG